MALITSISENKTGRSIVTQAPSRTDNHHHLRKHDFADWLLSKLHPELTIIIII
jgi:hypothetical protein